MLVLPPWERGTIVEAWKLWNTYASPEAYADERAFLVEVIDAGRDSLSALVHLAEKATGAGLLSPALAAAWRVASQEEYERWFWYWGQAYRDWLKAPAESRRRLAQAIREGRYIPPDPLIEVHLSPRSYLPHVGKV